MALTFQRGTKLTLTDGVNRYELLVSSASVSQTYLESTQAEKTLHDRNIVDRSFTTQKSTASLSFACHVSSTGASDSIIFEWFSFDNVSQEFKIVPNDVSLVYLDVYIQSGETIYKASNCVGENISFKLSHKEVLSVDVSAQGNSFEEVGSIPIVGTLFKQSDDTFVNGTLDVAGFSRVAGVTCEITRQISWLSQQSVFDIGSIYTVDTAVVRNMSISGSITQYKIDNIKTQTPSSSVVITYDGGFQISLDACQLYDRWDLGTVHTKMTDYKLLPSTTNSFIKF